MKNDCEWCNSSAATCSGQRGDRTVRLCEHCYRSLATLDHFEKKIRALYTMFASGRYSRILSRVESLRRRFLERNMPGWMTYELDKLEAHTLAKIGRYTESLAVFKSLTNKCSHDEFTYQMLQLSIVDLLLKLTKTEEAIAEIQQGLMSASGMPPGVALELLVVYSELSLKYNVNFPSSYKSILENIVGYFGLSVPFLCDAVPAAVSVLAVDGILARAKHRYQTFMEEFENILRYSKTDAIGHCSRYCAAEDVRFYRDLARVKLRELENEAESNNRF